MRWVHDTETAKPYAKGEGQSYMIADFVSANYGWLSSSDGSLTACVGLKPGANHDGYFGNDQVLAQVKTAIQLAKETYLDDEHIFIFDNACTHAKCADDALSACGLPKHTSKPGSNWMLKVKRHDVNGTLINEHICMHDATFANGTPHVRVCLRLGTCCILVLTELRCICRIGTQGDRSLLDAWAEMR